jgi:hypothetical protein
MAEFDVELGVPGRQRILASNSKFKGHSTGNGWFIAHPHPELEVPG